MKLLKYLPLCVLLVPALLSAKEMNIRTIMDIRGNAQIVSMQVFYANEPDGNNGEMPGAFVRYTFNDAGNLLVEEILESDKKTVFTVRKYDYDAKGKLVRMNAYNGKDELESYEKFAVDERKYTITAYQYHNDNTMKGYSVTEYSDKMKVLKAVIYNSAKEIVRTQQFWYDVNGELSKETSYMKEDGSEERETFIYKYELDANKNRIKETVTDGKGKVQTVIRYKRDGKGNITQREQYRLDEKGREILFRKTVFEIQYK